MTRAVVLHRTGGPEELKLEEVEVPPPGPGEARVRLEAVGLNFIDVYKRTGLYEVELPAVLGEEGAGVVEAVGAGVTAIAPGDRVASIKPTGCYAEVRNAPADRLVKLPDSVDAKTAAAMMLKALTADMLLRRIAKVEAGQDVLVHAAAGGVGRILSGWAAALGCRVIGTAGSKAKADIARAAGCADVILYRDEDVAARVRELTGGRGVTTAFDSVGKATFAGSLDSLAKRGLLISYGNASGPPDPIAPLELSKRGSLFLTRPTLFDYIAEPAELAEAAAVMFAAFEAKAFTVEIGQEFALADAAEAHRALEARATVGSTVLIPEPA